MMYVGRSHRGLFHGSGESTFRLVREGGSFNGMGISLSRVLFPRVLQSSARKEILCRFFEPVNG